MSIRATGAAGIILWLAFSGAARADLPSADGSVTDRAGILDADGRARLQALFRDTEARTSAEIAVATVPSLDGMTVEEYANRLFKAWGIGKKGIDNGVLLLVAPQEHKVRIEVGYGLEPILPDGLAGQIIRTEILPQFKQGRYQDGIVNGAEEIARIVDAHHVLTAAERKALDRGGLPPALLTVPFFGMFIGIGALAMGLGLRTRTGFPLIFGGLFGGIPFLMSLVPFFNATPWILVPLAITCLILGYRKGASPSWREMVRTARTDGGSTGWVMGGGGSSSGSDSGSSDWGSSGGDFGGGSSGGGGASGSW